MVVPERGAPITNSILTDTSLRSLLTVVLKGLIRSARDYAVPLAEMSNVAERGTKRIGYGAMA